MNTLIIGLIIFIGIHSLPMSASLRQILVTRLGENIYQGVFALTAITGFIIIILGKAYADFVPVWDPPVWTKHITLTLMPFALILLPAANMPGNIKRYTRHPMLWGVTLWAFAHLCANGDLASIILFASFGAYTVIAMLSANLRGAAKQRQKIPVVKDFMVIVAGLISYAIILVAHPYLFGVPVV